MYGRMGKWVSANFYQAFRCTQNLPEYWLSSLKVVTVVLFIIVGAAVNVGFNAEDRFIGFSNWNIDGAPFVGGFGGFARVFVTASFACKVYSYASYSIEP